MAGPPAPHVRMRSTLLAYCRATSPLGRPSWNESCQAARILQDHLLNHTKTRVEDAFPSTFFDGSKSAHKLGTSANWR